jgi:hypothetical protein
MKKFLIIFITAVCFLAQSREARAQGTIILDYRNGVVAGNTWTFDLYASGAADYIGPDQNNWQFMNVRMDIMLPVGCTIVSGSGTGNPTYTTGTVGVQTSVPGAPPAGSQEMGLTVSRTAQSDLTIVPVRVATFTIVFSCAVNPTDVSTPRTPLTTAGSFWTNLSSVPALGTRRAFGQPANFTLPVKFSSFTGTAANCTAQLKWGVEAEINTSYYIVEVSNGGDYREAGRVQSRNSTSGSSYSFDYSSSMNGRSTYRIRVVNADGTSSLSSALPLTGNCKSTIELTPNPARDIIRITGISPKDKIVITDAAGKQITTVVSAGIAQTVNVSGFAKGSYFVRIENAVKDAITLKMIKL